MSLIAETIVEEYFNYHGYFTIRGVKKGYNEIDLLAIRVKNKNKIETIHAEVQVSEKPVKYISNLTDDIRKKLNAKSNSSARNRNEDELRICCEKWVEKKFKNKLKQDLRNKLFPNQKWKYYLIHGKVRDERELEFIREFSVETKDIRDLIFEMSTFSLRKFGTSSTGRDIINLFKLFYEKEIAEKKVQD
jgi:hypothetical protein